ncbi:MAG: tRNA pseudouridine synthase A [Chlamydiia bacterium]|nr:tRNA pseudouridine synthase A [Chlamydiia bacterium]MCH9615139.1 tRNA pseudouridine synthase A [Chlamydiia bacterium]MCH9628539.1 tRNA pseudouridine synthase A [Chlamydiia bacterium]
MKNYKLNICYEGTNYFGWQDNKSELTIESLLLKALTRIYGHSPKLQAASRTDRGVHAKEQVVNFLAPPLIPETIMVKAINRYLPKDIRVLSVTIEKDTFHPTLDNHFKEYVYRITNTPVQLPFDRHLSWHVKPSLNLKFMRQAATHFTGTHNFKCFCNQSPSIPYDKTRTIATIDIQGHGDILITIKGENFLYKMVRNIVGTLVYIGLGKIGINEVDTIIKSGDRKLAGMTAPAHGLTLNKVYYDLEK